MEKYHRENVDEMLARQLSLQDIVMMPNNNIREPYLIQEQMDWISKEKFEVIDVYMMQQEENSEIEDLKYPEVPKDKSWKELSEIFNISIKISKFSEDNDIKSHIGEIADYQSKTNDRFRTQVRIAKERKKLTLTDRLDSRNYAQAKVLEGQIGALVNSSLPEYLLSSKEYTPNSLTHFYTNLAKLSETHNALMESTKSLVDKASSKGYEQSIRELQSKWLSFDESFKQHKWFSVLDNSKKVNFENSGCEVIKKVDSLLKVYDKCASYTRLGNKPTRAEYDEAFSNNAKLVEEVLKISDYSNAILQAAWEISKLVSDAGFKYAKQEISSGS
jgi:hypothetical protein